jgi:hypothetical protein
MMTYNPPYYIKLIESAGFTKAKDLLAYHFFVDAKPLERLSRLADGVLRREKDLVIKQVRKKHLAEDLVKVKEVYNAAWEDNWGFVPMTDGDIDFMASRLKPLLVEPFILLAETAEGPIAFLMALPDYNVAIKPLRGKLLSPHLFQFLQHVLGWKHPPLARVITMGVKKNYRLRGIDAVMFARMLKTGLELGYRQCEVSWVLEDNYMVERPVKVFGGSKYKTYRIYERAVR